MPPSANKQIGYKSRGSCDSVGGNATQRKTAEITFLAKDCADSLAADYTDFLLATKRHKRNQTQIPDSIGTSFADYADTYGTSLGFGSYDESSKFSVHYHILFVRYILYNK